MRLTERLFLLSVIFCSVVLCDIIKPKERKGRHFLMLLGYLHGYKIGQDYALKFPSYFASPVIIFPTINQQQSVSVQNGLADENYQENGGIDQTITSAKLMSNNMTELSKENDDIEVRFGVPSEKPVNDNNATLRQNTNDNSTDTTINTDTEEVEMTTIATTVTKEHIETTTKSSGPYTNPLYNNEIINSLTITTAPNEDLPLPPVSDNRWQKFTVRANPSDLVDGNATLIDDLQNNTLSPLSTEIVTEYPVATTITFSNGPYPNALYNNAVIDQLSITTNSYTNEDSPLPAQDDRWNSFYSIKSGGFKPLAGLYYDGYLHRPLNKFPFLTQNYI